MAPVVALVRSQGTRQWLGHPCPGLAALFVNPTTTEPHRLHTLQFPATRRRFIMLGPSRIYYYCNEFRDSSDHPGFTNIQPQTLYNNTSEVRRAIGSHESRHLRLGRGLARFEAHLMRTRRGSSKPT